MYLRAEPSEHQPRAAEKLAPPLVGTMMSYMRERRLGNRIPMPLMFMSYVRDRPIRSWCSDLSDTGVGLATVASLAPQPGTVVAVELELPGISDSLWASGEVCFRKPDSLATGVGVRFTAMARAHARLLHDFCVESRRGYLASLLSRIRPSAA